MVFYYFCYVGHVMLDEKINKNQVKKQIKVKMQVGLDFGWLLDRFWKDFGRVLGAKLGLKPIENLLKVDVER